MGSIFFAFFLLPIFFFFFFLFKVPVFFFCLSIVANQHTIPLTPSSMENKKKKKVEK